MGNLSILLHGQLENQNLFGLMRLDGRMMPSLPQEPARL